MTVRRARQLCLVAACCASTQSAAQQVPVQQVPVRDTVRAIAPPRSPIPPEDSSASVTRFSFIVYGDTRGREDGKAIQHEHSVVVASMLETIAQRSRSRSPVRFVLQSGDAVVNGGDAAQWNVSFVELINRLTRDAGVPYFLAPGNHDVTSSADLNSPARARALGNYLQAMRQLMPPTGATRRLDGYPTYAFGFGNTFVVAFDSNIADDTTQFAWVEGQLAGLDRRRYRNIVVLFHHPVFSSGPHGGANVEAPTAVLRTKWMPMFRRYGVRLLLAGHDHLFEHWTERYKDASGWHRIDQLVTGGGGAPLYRYSGDPDTRAYLRASAADSVRLERLVRPGVEPGENPYHYVVVSVDGNRLSLEYVGVDWGRGFQPYRSARADLVQPDTTRPPR